MIRWKNALVTWLSWLPLGSSMTISELEHNTLSKTQTWIRLCVATFYWTSPLLRYPISCHSATLSFLSLCGYSTNVDWGCLSLSYSRHSSVSDFRNCKYVVSKLAFTIFWIGNPGVMAILCAYWAEVWSRHLNQCPKTCERNCKCCTARKLIK